LRPKLSWTTGPTGTPAVGATPRFGGTVRATIVCASSQSMPPASMSCNATDTFARRAVATSPTQSSVAAVRSCATM
jgi:hypothetical protein